MIGFLVVLTLAGLSFGAAADSRGVEHGRRYDRLVIRNVVVIDGKGTPARGPMDVIVEGNKIAGVRGGFIYTLYGFTRGGIKWTIKDGYVYETPRLMREVKEMVAKARAAR